MAKEEYRGREHAGFKHLVLGEYVRTWAIKLGSRAQRGPVTLCYVDGFAGAWESKAPDRSDASAVIGLRALKASRATWSAHAHKIRLKAVLVDEDAERFAELEEIAKAEGDDIDVLPLHGDFIEKLPEVQRHILPNDAAVFFVDPYGWEDASIELMKPLAGPRVWEVLINLMSPFAQRAAGMEKHDWMDAKMRAFFAFRGESLTKPTSEQHLVDEYREQLKRVCGYRYAADILIPDPVAARPKYRLVLGTQSEVGVQVFRTVEEQLRKNAAEVRAQTREEKRTSTSPQEELFQSYDLAPDTYLDDLRDQDLPAAQERVLDVVKQPTAWRDLWPAILEVHHIPETELAKLVGKLRKAGRIEVRGWKPKQRRPHDDNVILLPRDPS